MASLRTREYGVRAADLEAQRAALVEFAGEMYRPLVRCDQRAKGEQYVRGLLLEGRRKSIQPMAARLPDGDEEGLQQFITDSPWEDEPVRRRLAWRMTGEIEPEGWIVDDTGLPKDGRFSPGVAHQYYRELKQCLGLDHYEGRTFCGLHHHLTCVTVAHAFLTCSRLARGDPDAARPQMAAA